MVKFPKRPLYKYTLAAIDWLTVSAALLMGFNLREHWLPGSGFVLDSAFYRDMTFSFSYGAVGVFIFHYFNLYKINVFITLVDHTVQLLKAVAVAVVGIAVISFFTKAPWVIDSRLAVALFFVLVVTFSFAFRLICFRSLFLWLSKHRILRRNVLIVGAGKAGRSLAMNIGVHGHGGLNVVGFIDDELQVGQPVFAGARVVGTLADLPHAAEDLAVQEVIVCLDNVDHARMMGVVETATKTGKRVKISSPLYEIISSRTFTEQYGNAPVVNISQSQPSPFGEMQKRLFDLLIGTACLVVLSPFFVIIGLLIVADSPGPVLYRQSRIGKNGAPFTFYKFRSMLLGSDKDETRKHLATQFVKGQYNGDNGNASTKIVNESRVTKVGKWLRKSSLDELPQLFNVLKGEMSLVGPRPCLPYEWEHYEEWHKKRMSVVPGCTGMWQVSGRSAVGFDDMVVLDLHYIQNSSLLLDLRLLLKTVPILVWGTGAK